MIATLAVLAAAIAAGSCSLTGGTNTESAKTIASTILTYLNTLDTAISKIENSGYGHAQISFEMDSSDHTVGPDAVDYDSRFTNPSCTSDYCKVFKPLGGGILPFLLPADAFDANCISMQVDDGNNGVTDCSPVSNTPSCRNIFGLYPNNIVTPATLAEARIEGIGSSTWRRYSIEVICVKPSVCRELNKLIGVGNTSTGVLSEGSSASGADGGVITLPLTTYSYANVWTGSQIKGRITFCIEYSAFAMLAHQM